MSGGHGHVDSSNKKIALLVAVLAALLAISEMGGKSSQTNALSSHIDASNLWTFFQAKTIRQTTMRTAAALFVLALAAPLPADGPKVHRGLAYADTKNERQTLDVYAPAAGQKLPVVVWIHGGGWQRGDKSEVQQKPQAFVDKGFVFVAINYRLLPDVTIKHMAQDVAKAIRWVHDHAKDYGGDPDTVFVMGHSAGAQLAALVAYSSIVLALASVRLRRQWS